MSSFIVLDVAVPFAKRADLLAFMEAVIVIPQKTHVAIPPNSKVRCYKGYHTVIPVISFLILRVLHIQRVGAGESKDITRASLVSRFLLHTRILYWLDKRCWNNLISYHPQPLVPTHPCLLLHPDDVLPFSIQYHGPVSFFFILITFLIFLSTRAFAIVNAWGKHRTDLGGENGVLWKETAFPNDSLASFGCFSIFLLHVNPV